MKERKKTQPIAEKAESRKGRDSRLIRPRIDEELLERIDDFRSENRFNDRTRALRWLLKWTLYHAGENARPGPGNPLDPQNRLRDLTPEVTNEARSQQEPQNQATAQNATRLARPAGDARRQDHDSAV